MKLLKKRIMIKKNPLINWMMFGVYIVLLIWAYIQPGRILSELVMLLSFTMILDGIYFFISQRYIKIEMPLEIMVELRQYVDIKISVRNEAYIPSGYIYLIAKQGKRIELQDTSCIGLLLEGKGRVERGITYRGKYCGTESISLEHIMIKSFIGFFRKEVKQHLLMTVHILPEIKHLNSMKYFNEYLWQTAEGINRKIAQPLKKNLREEVGYELKPYVMGDSEKLIHWKIATFKEEYLVRERQGDRFQRTELFFILSPFMSGKGDCLDMQDEMSRVIELDRTVTIFISLVAYYLEAGEKVQIAYYNEGDGWQYMKLKTKSQLRHLQESLSRYEGVYVESTMNQRMIIKQLLQILKKKGGKKIIISAYWRQEVEEYILEYKEIRTDIPVVWTANEEVDMFGIYSHFTFWTLNHEYSRVPIQQTKSGGEYEEADNRS